jgi:hydroxyacylglutathione hydrolase
MVLTNRVRLVASGDVGGFGLTNPSDCHVYLMEGDEGSVVVDAGSGLDVGAILAAIPDPDEVKYLLVTHSHLDHSGGVARLKSELGLEVVASPEAARILSEADEVAISLPAARDVGIYPKNAKLSPCQVDVPVVGETWLTVGGLTILGIPSPGHSEDHVVYLVQANGYSALFTGDSVMAGGRLIIQNVPDCDLPAYVATIRRLAEIEPDGLYPGHGMFTINRGDRHLRAAFDYVQRLEIPPNLVLE